MDSNNLCFNVSICSFYVGKGVGAHRSGAEMGLSQVLLQCIAAIHILGLQFISVSVAGNFTLRLLTLSFFLSSVYKGFDPTTIWIFLTQRFSAVVRSCDKAMFLIFPSSYDTFHFLWNIFPFALSLRW